MHSKCKYAGESHTKGNTQVKEGRLHEMGAPMWDFLGTQKLTCACTSELQWLQSERMYTRVHRCTCSALIYNLGPTGQREIGDYLHWKALESAARCTQLKHILALSTQSHYMLDPTLQRHRGEVEEFRKSLCLFTTHCLIVLVFSCSPSSSWANSCHWQETVYCSFFQGPVFTKSRLTC